MLLLLAPLVLAPARAAEPVPASRSLPARRGDPQCSVDRLEKAIERAQFVYVHASETIVGDFARSADEVLAAVACTNATLQPALVARVHRVMAVRYFLEGYEVPSQASENRVRGALRAMTMTDPNLGLQGFEASRQHPLYVLLDETRLSTRYNPPAFTSLSSRVPARFRVNGEERTARYEGQPALVQVVVDGRVYGSRWLAADESAAAWIASVNLPPSLAKVTITPQRAYTNSTLEAAVSGASDPEGKPVTYTYEWSVEGVEVSTSATLNGRVFSRGQAVTVTVTPSDGELEGPPVTAERTILDAPPTEPTVAIDPRLPRNGDSLICGVVGKSQDIDGDSITYSYAWTVEAQPRSDQASVSPAETRPREHWICLVTPQANGMAGPAGSAEVEIRRTRGGLLAAGLTFTTLAVAGSVVAWQEGLAYDDVTNPAVADRDDLDRLRTATNVIAGASLAAGGLGMALSVGGLVPLSANTPPTLALSWRW